MKLAGKVALVTGAGRGIGRAVALEFAAEGARVAVAARTQAEIDAVAAECGPGAIAIALDLGDESACVGAVRTCEAALGPIDIVVNSAGIGASGKFEELRTDTWRQIMLVDLDGPFWLSRAVVGGMVARGSGAIIMIGSVASRVGFPYVAAYVAAKHGLLGLVRAMAAEYASSGVTFNCVCPFYVDTSMTMATIENIVLKTGRSREDALKPLLNPQGRLVTPREIAALCTLLASEEGRSINGQAINVDGGLMQS